MNTPTHIAAGALLSQLVIRRIRGTGRLSLIFTGCCCFVAGLVSHLLLDLAPHYAWVVYLPGFDDLPFHWLIREAMLGIIVALPLIYFARDHWGYTVLGMIGAMYPDIEKVAYIDFGMPGRLVLFRWHSMALSDRDGGLPSGRLILIECALIAGLIIGTLWLTKDRRRAK